VGETALVAQGNWVGAAVGEPLGIGAADGLEASLQGMMIQSN